MNQREQAVVDAARAYCENLEGHLLAALNAAVADLDTFASPGLELVAAERRRQVMEEGWTPEHDDVHDPGDLATAAVAYLALDAPAVDVDEEDIWPWPDLWKPSENPIRNLVRGAALAIAEIDKRMRTGEWPT